MVLTRDFKETVQFRAQSDRKYRFALLEEAVNELFTGNVDSGKEILRDYVNATVSFGKLAKKMNKNSKSIQRMLSASGNPTTNTLFNLLRFLQEEEAAHFEITLKKNH